jgi:hypothetical protein
MATCIVRNKTELLYRFNKPLGNTPLVPVSSKKYQIYDLNAYNFKQSIILYLSYLSLSAQGFQLHFHIDRDEI